MTSEATNGNTPDDRDDAAGPTVWIQLDDLAAELDVTRDTIDTLAGQVADDPDLYDDGRLTEAGADLVRAQIASGSGVQAVLDDAAAAQAMYVQGKEARGPAVRAARSAGASWQQIADAMRLPSREHARAIANS